MSRAVGCLLSHGDILQITPKECVSCPKPNMQQAIASLASRSRKVHVAHIISWLVGLRRLQKNRTCALLELGGRDPPNAQRLPSRVHRVEPVAAAFVRSSRRLPWSDAKRLGVQPLGQHRAWSSIHIAWCLGTLTSFVER